MEMKVISFRVSDDVYYALKKKKTGFRAIFEPYAVELAQKSSKGLVYMPNIQKNSAGLYIYLSQIERNLKSLNEIVEKMKKEV